MSESTLTGTAAAALNLVGQLTTLLANKGVITRLEFEALVKRAASDDETRDAIRQIWSDVV